MACQHSHTWDSTPHARMAESTPNDQVAYQRQPFSHVQVAVVVRSTCVDSRRSNDVAEPAS